MRIGLVVQGGADRSGRERVVPALLWLVERLARRHRVHVFALRHYAEPCTYSLRGATVHDLGGFRTPAPGPLRMLRALVGALRAAGPFDVLHGHLGGTPGALTAAAGRWLRVPVVVTLADGELVGLPDIAYGLQLSWRGRLLVRTSLGLARRRIVTSEAMARALRARGLDSELIPLGVDTRLFAAPLAPPPGPPFRLLHVATLSRVKDQVTLLRALRRVVDRLPDVHLDVVGEDTLGGAIQAEAARLGLLGHARFLGFQPTEVVADLLRAAHLFLLSSRHEACSVAVLEAAACAVPTVGTAVGHVADGAPARASAVPVGDAEAFADAVLTLLRDPQRRDAMGRAAYAWAVAQDADWTAARLEGVYQQLAAERG